MIEIVLIDDTDRFNRAIQRRFQGLANIFPIHPSNISTTGTSILAKHPDAHVFIDLSPRAVNGHTTLENGVGLAKVVLADYHKDAARVHVCGPDSLAELTVAIREDLDKIGVEYVQKSQIEDKIEQLTGSGQSVPAFSKKGSRRSVLRDPVIRKQYAGQVVAVWNGQVLGAGANLDAALIAASARPECPPVEQLVIALIPEEEGSIVYAPPPAIKPEYLDERIPKPLHD